MSIARGIGGLNKHCLYSNLCDYPQTEKQISTNQNMTKNFVLGNDYDKMTSDMLTNAENDNDTEANTDQLWGEGMKRQKFKQKWKIIQPKKKIKKQKNPETKTKTKAKTKTKTPETKTKTKAKTKTKTKTKTKPPKKTKTKHNVKTKAYEKKKNNSTGCKKRHKDEFNKDIFNIV